MGSDKKSPALILQTKNKKSIFGRRGHIVREGEKKSFFDRIFSVVR